ncbi:MAG TPA: MgtC/SapB family protein [Terriglobales bacterium]|nr:MgtC/SapB family protein [Terriglobales bacterium]
MPAELESIVGLLTAALGGAAVGLEREWSGHASGPDARFAGIRTFTLLGGMAGMAGWLWAVQYTVFAAILLAAGAALVVAAYVSSARHSVEATTEVAALVVLGAGLLSGIGHLRLASAIFALTVLLLAEKSQLHAMVARIDDVSLRAGIRFAVMAVVILPLLPEGPYGPLGGIRPRLLWMLTLFFSGLSFGGYIARRLVGDRLGYPLAGLLGGMVSSTNVTFTFARLSREEARTRGPLALGVVAACTVMFLRILTATTVLSPPLTLALIPHFAVPFLLGAAALLPLLRRGPPEAPSPVEMKNPLQVWSALQMAALFQVVLFGVHAMQQRFGEAGLLLAAAVLGLTDMDALTISMSRNNTAIALGAQAITVGVISNSILKTLLAVVLGRGKFRLQAGAFLLVTALVLAGSLLWLR